MSYYINLYIKRFNIQFVLGQLKTKTNTEISFSFRLSLFYSIPFLSPHRLTDWQRVTYTRFAWAGGTFFPVVFLCCVSVWFLQEQGFWSTVCLLGARFWRLRLEKKDTVVCLAGARSLLRPEKKNIQSSVWWVRDHVCLSCRDRYILY